MTEPTAASANPEPAWLLARQPVALQDQARRLLRWARQNGAAAVWLEGAALIAVWPEGEAGRQAVAALADRAGQPAQVARITGQDPRAAWQAPPLDRIHPRLALTPAWSGLSAGPGVLVIDPLTAFGAGDHPSTRLNLLLLARLLDQDPPPAGAWVADVGAGTGVLALAMSLLAGLKVLAVDPDPAAARATARNQALNPLAGGRVAFVRATHAVLAAQFPLIAANLPGPLLLMVAPRLRECLAPGGRLVVSGFRAEYAPKVERACTALGLGLQDQADQAGWVGLTCRVGRVPPAGRTRVGRVPPAGRVRVG